ncbi:MAG: MBL fold metallo-hydrolase [Myxococcota bacterium]
MRVTFWGVRGSVPVSGGGFARTGGNTTCVEIEHDGAQLVLDGGTGLAALGASRAGPMDAALLFTHVHWDHIQGVPFFRPAFDPRSRLRLVGAPGTYAALDAQMRPPSFPVGMDAFRAALEPMEILPERELHLGPFVVRAAEMTHPNGVYCYRIEAAGHSVVFATDVEHGDALDPRLVDLARGADLLIHDAQYTDAEYPSRRGWGHSTWEQALELADTARAGRVALFHHDPLRTDPELAQIESVATRRHHTAFAAREGVVVAL